MSGGLRGVMNDDLPDLGVDNLYGGQPFDHLHASLAIGAPPDRGLVRRNHRS